MLDTGVRVAEALALAPADIDFDNMIVKVHGKANKQRLVPMSFEARKRLWQYRTRARGASADRIERRYFFATRTGTRVTVRNFQQDFKIMGQRLGIAGVRMSPHTVRHTLAVSYLRNAGNLFYLSKILGHTSVTTTQQYLQSLGVEDLQAVHNKFSFIQFVRARVAKSRPCLRVAARGGGGYFEFCVCSL